MQRRRTPLETALGGGNGLARPGVMGASHAQCPREGLEATLRDMMIIFTASFIDVQRQGRTHGEASVKFLQEVRIELTNPVTAEGHVKGEKWPP